MSTRFLVVTGDGAEADQLRLALSSDSGGETSVEWAPSLARALSSLREHVSSLILLDCNLPDSTALASFDALQTMAPRTPIVTLHNNSSDTLAVETLRRGARGFLLHGSHDNYLLRQNLDSILKHHAIEQRYLAHYARAELTLNSIEDTVLSTGRDGRIDYLNDAAGRLTGWNLHEAIGVPACQVLQFLDKTSLKPIRNPLEAVLELHGPIRLPAGTILVRRDGSEAAIEDSTAPIWDAGGELAGAVIVFHDVTTAQEMVRQMEHLASHDFLTDLPNRSLLEDRIGQAISMARREGTAAAVVYLDLDNFKHINDSLGHHAGDQLLCMVARRLSDCVRASDTVSRQGGDEFAILIPDNQSPGQAALTAAKILAALADPYRIGQHELRITGSIGISLFPYDGEDATTLLKNADTAMYIAKEQGRDNCKFFEQAMNERAVERLLLQTNLRLALDSNQFLLHYQPKVNLATEAVIGAEALIRWQHPEWGMVAPERFIGVAEDVGLIVQIGRWALREACMQVRRWQLAGLRIDSIAVNVSAMEFRQPGFIEGVRENIAATGIEPGCLELEITESILMHDTDATRAVLTALKKMGIRLAVDDFGTGYSSLGYLKRFPVDVLKIDRSFVSGIGTPGDDGSIASAVIAMGNSLNFRVVAEGVKDQFQLDFLRRHHCAEGQGYFFSEPVSSHVFESMLLPTAGTALN